MRQDSGGARDRTALAPPTFSGPATVIGARRRLDQVAAAVDTGVAADAGAVDAAEGRAADAVDTVLDIRNKAHAVSLALDIAGAAVVHPVEEMNTLTVAEELARRTRAARPIDAVGRTADPAATGCARGAAGNLVRVQ